jgi:hypothetical protein
LDGALNINPSIGIGNGNFQSGGGRPVVADDIVPTVNLTYTTGDLTIAAGSINWFSFRKESKVTPYYDLFDYYINPMYALSKYISVGLNYDHFRIKTDIEGKTETTTSYLWAGPAMRITVNSGASVFFTAGVDLVDYANDIPGKILRDYYKLSLTVPF